MSRCEGDGHASGDIVPELEMKNDGKQIASVDTVQNSEITEIKTCGQAESQLPNS